jgi:four helix bundle protein
MKDTKYDLEERLIDFAITVSDIVDGLPVDFIHKMKIILKELRESLISIKIIERKKLHDMEKVLKAKDECNQLVSIFVKIIETDKKNNIK